MEFTIDEKYFDDLTIRKGYSIYQGRKELTDDELVEILKGDDIVVTTTNIDHPEFTKLRNELELKKFIKTERGYWNGDHVLKPFKLNGIQFAKNEQFLCAVAMKIYLKYKVR